MSDFPTLTHAENELVAKLKGLLKAFNEAAEIARYESSSVRFVIDEGPDGNVTVVDNPEVMLIRLAVPGHKTITLA